MTTHEWTGPTGVKFVDVMEPSGVYYRDTTPRPVIDALERARKSWGSRVRLFYGDKQTGRDWGEENDVTGRVGRTGGRIPVPILLHNSRSIGGGAILCENIVRLIVDGREVYRHPHYHQPAYAILFNSKGASVLADGQHVASFDSKPQAERWIAFMTGRRMTK